MQRAAISGIPVGGGEVYCHLRRKHARTRMNEWTAPMRRHAAERAEEIRSRTYCELNLAAPHDVIQEGIHFDDLQLETRRDKIGSGKKERAATDRH